MKIIGISMILLAILILFIITARCAGIKDAAVIWGISVVVVGLIGIGAVLSGS